MVFLILIGASIFSLVFRGLGGEELITEIFNMIPGGLFVAINLQTSFLTPPFGFALFYLRSVVPEKIKTETMYEGVLPFIVIQIFVLCLVAYFPTLATFLPNLIFSNSY